MSAPGITYSRLTTLPYTATFNPIIPSSLDGVLHAIRVVTLAIPQPRPPHDAPRGGVLNINVCR